MANDRQSLTNYETILWLWDATDEQRVSFLASLDPRQRSQFCDVLRDVLNNPWDEQGRSAIKLTKLNKLLGQNVDRIKKQVQFSGDKTPELDEAQIFRLFHDYTVLNHDGTRKLSKLGRESLQQLLKIVDGEFQTFYGRDQNHPLLMWNGFLNDSQFPSDGMEKSQVEPSDYGELNDKISNYYYPVGGKPTPHGGGQEEETYRNEEEPTPTPRYEYSALSLFGLVSKYVSLFVVHAMVAVCGGILGFGNPWTIAFALASLFASVKWYHFFKFCDRGWAALLQGFWVLYFIMGFFASLCGSVIYGLNLIWPAALFVWLCPKLERNSRHCKAFSIVGGVLMASMCLMGIIGYDVNGYGNEYFYSSTPTYRPSSRGAGGSSRSTTSTTGASTSRSSTTSTSTSIRHIDELRRRSGGISWDGLEAADIVYLTPSEKKTLRLQLVNLLRRSDSAVTMETLEDLKPSSNSKYKWQARVSYNMPLYVIVDEDEGVSKALGYCGVDLRTSSVLVDEGSPVMCWFTPTSYGLNLRYASAYENKRGYQVLTESTLREYLKYKGRLVIKEGSQAHRDLAALARVLEKIISQMQADKQIMLADNVARDRYNEYKKRLSFVSDELRAMAKSDQQQTTLSVSLKSFIGNPDGWNAQTAVQTAPAEKIQTVKRVVSPHIQKVVVQQPNVQKPVAQQPVVQQVAAQKSVVYKRCNKCRGNGSIEVREKCSTCQGSRYVENVVGQTVDAALAIADMASSRRRRSRRASTKRIPCPACNRKGYSTVKQVCPNCSGTGKVAK